LSILKKNIKWAEYEETWKKFSSIHKCRADYINIDHDLEPFKDGITEQMTFIADNMNHNYKFQILNNTVHFYRRQDEEHPAFKKRNPNYRRLRLPPEIPYARTMKRQIEEVIEAGAKIPDLEFSFSFLDVPRVFPYPNQKEQVGHPFDNLKVMMKEVMKKKIENNPDPKFKQEIEFFYNESLQHCSLWYPVRSDVSYELTPSFGRATMPYFFKDIRFPENKFTKNIWNDKLREMEAYNKKV